MYTAGKRKCEYMRLALNEEDFLNTFPLISLVTAFSVCLTEQEQSSKPSSVNTFCCCYSALCFLRRNLAHGTCQLRSQHPGKLVLVFYRDVSDKVFNDICQELKLRCEGRKKKKWCYL